VAEPRRSNCNAGCDEIDPDTVTHKEDDRDKNDKSQQAVCRYPLRTTGDTVDRIKKVASGTGETGCTRTRDATPFEWSDDFFFSPTEL